MKGEKSIVVLRAATGRRGEEKGIKGDRGPKRRERKRSKGREGGRWQCTD